jgi:microcin C transport system permease protein
MSHYILQRILLMIPTLLGIMAINFFIVHIAPGGPLDYVLSRLESSETQQSEGVVRDPVKSKTHHSQSTDEHMMAQLRERFEFDKPLSTRFFNMVKRYLRFDLGESYFKGESVGSLISSRLSVSVSIGLWSLFFTYLFAVPLGIVKAMKDGSVFDTWSSIFVILGYAVPSFLFGMLLIIFFAGGTFWSWFPLKGLFSEHWASLSWWGKTKDYFWHLTLPLMAQVFSSFGALTLMVKNAFCEELRKPYVLMSRAQGMTEGKVLTKAVFLFRE